MTDDTRTICERVSVRMLRKRRGLNVRINKKIGVKVRQGQEQARRARKPKWSGRETTRDSNDRGRKVSMGDKGGREEEGGGQRWRRKDTDGEIRAGS